MVALITFYRLARPVLRSYNILRKFLVIKVIIFLTVLYVLAILADSIVRVHARATLLPRVYSS